MSNQYPYIGGAQCIYNLKEQIESSLDEVDLNLELGRIEKSFSNISQGLDKLINESK